MDLTGIWIPWRSSLTSASWPGS